MAPMACWQNYLGAPNHLKDRFLPCHGIGDMVMLLKFRGWHPSKN